MVNLDKLAKTEQRYWEIETLLADTGIINNKQEYQKLAKEFADLTPIITSLREYKEVLKQEEELKFLLKEKHDADFEDLAKSELHDLDAKRTALDETLEAFLNPQVQQKDRNLIIEIRAGTGGLEAGLFAADLYRMYLKYSDKKGWKFDPISSHESDTGGFKEVIFSVSGKGAAQRLKWESGAHRVQRVPTTEASGRIHTSAATVAVLFEPEEVDVQIDPKDLKIDIFRSSGPGGQSVNTTDSAVRITHLPTGTVVVCQDERSQLKNKTKAFRVLRARLHEHYVQANLAKEMAERKQKVGTGDRSDKIRTYNYPDRRVTDHRIGFTTHKLEMVMDGDLDDLTDALIVAEKEGKLS